MTKVVKKVYFYIREQYVSLCIHGYFLTLDALEINVYSARFARISFTSSNDRAPKPVDVLKRTLKFTAGKNEKNK